MKTRKKQIQIDDLVYWELVGLKLRLSKKTNSLVSFSDTIKHLLSIEQVYEHQRS